MSKTIIADNLIRVREMVDIDGNVIDPRTKQIIRKAEEASVPPVEKTDE